MGNWQLATDLSCYCWLFSEKVRWMTLILSYPAVKQKDATQKNIKECVASNQKLLPLIF